MSCELERIAADIIIAKMNAQPSYAAESDAKKLAEDFQTLLTQVRYSGRIADRSDLAKTAKN